MPAPRLAAFIALLLATHLAVTLSLGTALGLPRAELLIASNANVGGPATAAAMAAARGWPALVRPAVFMGCVGAFRMAAARKAA